MKAVREPIARRSGSGAVWYRSTIFANGRKVDSGKQPYAIALKSRSLMAFAGLWENWRSPAGERIRSFAIVTTEPNELCAELHNRMPVILAPEAWPAWLGEEPADEPHLKALLAPHPAIAPAGSNRSRHGGDEMSEAFG